MPSKTKGAPRLTFRPLTPDRWDDFETLFGEHGAYAGCWCMWWRLTRKEFQKGTRGANKKAMQGIVASGDAPGIIAYAGRKPAGWCAVAPREAYGSLNRSRTLKRVDDQPAWSITCFYIDEAYRGRGVMASLLKAAADFAQERGARIVEGYPIESTKRLPDSWEAYRGSISAFRDAGFVEVVRRSERKPIMRWVAGDS